MIWNVPVIDLFKMTKVSSHCSVELILLLSPSVICAFCFVFSGGGFIWLTNRRSTKSMLAPESINALPRSCATLTLKISCELSSVAGVLLCSPAAGAVAVSGRDGLHVSQKRVSFSAFVAHGSGRHHAAQRPHLFSTGIGTASLLSCVPCRCTLRLVCGPAAARFF
jgi:hypothetical protein